MKGMKSVILARRRFVRTDSRLLVGLEIRGGKPDASWTPDLEDERDCREMAKHSMDEQEWTDATELNERSECRFFMVSRGRRFWLDSGGGGGQNGVAGDSER